MLSFTDGNIVVPMVSSMDHKRAHDNDEGLNTGGMGTVAPNPYYTPEIAKICMDTIFLPTIRAMKAEGREFRGCLYFGLMLTKNGPKVSEGKLADCEIKFADKAACCVIIASKGYPVKYESGFEIKLPEKTPDTDIYVAGAKLADGKLLSAGGRVLGVTAVAGSLEEAIHRAYEHTQKVEFENGFYRHDIGKRALAALKK